MHGTLLLQDPIRGAYHFEEHRHLSRFSGSNLTTATWLLNQERGRLSYHHLWIRFFTFVVAAFDSLMSPKRYSGTRDRTRGLFFEIRRKSFFGVPRMKIDRFLSLLATSDAGDSIVLVFAVIELT
jgi:hypothetical protein